VLGRRAQSRASPQRPRPLSARRRRSQSSTRLDELFLTVCVDMHPRRGAVIGQDHREGWRTTSPGRSSGTRTNGPCDEANRSARHDFSGPSSNRAGGAQSIVAPFVAKMTRRHAPALLGGIGLASTLVALLLAALLSRGLTIRGWVHG
jgi:hypothetical protein